MAAAETKTVTGTKVAVVIGQPVEHSLSPVMHNAAFASLDLDWHYFALSVPEGGSGAAVDAMRSLGFAGMSVTMPHKAAVAGAVDTCTPVAQALGAVNCIYWRGNELIGDNTDGAGFVDALRNDEGFEFEGRRVVVVGAGGAARAVIMAVAGAGAAEVAIVNRTARHGETAAALAGPVGRTAPADAVSEADLVVNATPVGMNDSALPIDPERLGAGQLVVDLIYEPALTPLLAAARERGAVAVNGLGMLIHQAAYAFRLWTGEDPPVEVMSATATAELIARSRHR